MKQDGVSGGSKREKLADELEERQKQEEKADTSTETDTRLSPYSTHTYYTSLSTVFSHRLQVYRPSTSEDTTFRCQLRQKIA